MNIHGPICFAYNMFCEASAEELVVLVLNGR